jgi:regulator of replication initiation timing
MKVQQFYQLDDKKLKELIAEVEALRKELKRTRAEICQLQLHNDFLTRTNAHLKLQLE